jgi:hypothetical protein
MTAASPSTIYNYAPQIWDAARQQCTRVLIQRARARDTITYGELTREITEIHFHPHDSAFHAMLYEISVMEDRDGRGLLSALVIHAPDATEGANRPGDGFWGCASDCGRNISNRERCWIEEVTRVFDEQARAHQ